MKIAIRLLAAAALALAALTANAAKNVQAGPKGGRLLEMETARAEFFVEKDKTVSLTFYNAEMKPVAVTTQSATITAEIKAGRVKLEFEKKGGLLVSKTPLPEGEGYTVVVQVKTTADARPRNFRIPLELHTCGGCNRAEYACTCEE